MLGAETELTREEFFDYGRRFATSYERTIAGTAPQVADHLEEVFEATGSRGGFMLGHVVSMRRRSSPKVDDKLVRCWSTAETMPIEISAAISPYSIQMTPLWSFHSLRSARTVLRFGRPS
jgi:hypothetical protein